MHSTGYGMRIRGYGMHGGDMARFVEATLCMGYTMHEEGMACIPEGIACSGRVWHAMGA